MNDAEEKGLLHALLSLTRQVNDLQAFRVAATRLLAEAAGDSPRLAEFARKLPEYQNEALQEVLFAIEDSNPWLAAQLANRPTDSGQQH
jgi:hypothetical protein